MEQAVNNALHSCLRYFSECTHRMRNLFWMLHLNMRTGNARDMEKLIHHTTDDDKTVAISETDTLVFCVTEGAGQWEEEETKQKEERGDKRRLFFMCYLLLLQWKRIVMPPSVWNKLSTLLSPSSHVSVPVFLLVMVFALSSWVDINGLCVQFPLMVQRLPEGWDLPSYCAILFQLANVGPLIFTLVDRLSPTRVREWPVVYLIIGVGAVACLILSKSWDMTSYIAGQERSTALLSLAACLALVDTTSSVVYLPYMGNFKPQYMTAFYIGEGLGALLPGLVGLIQGVGVEAECRNVTSTDPVSGLSEFNIEPFYKPPIFSVSTFFLLLFAMLCASAISFTCLQFGHRCQKEKVNHYQDYVEEGDTSIPGQEQSTQLPSQVDDTFDTEPNIHCPVDSASDKCLPHVAIRDVQQETLPKAQYVLLLVATTWINALINGVLISTQSYSSLPYGNRAYTLAVRLAAVSNPVACLLALFLPRSSVRAVSVLTLVASVLSGYQIYLAALSPRPPLQDNIMGELLVIFTSVLITAIFSYTKVAIAIILRSEGRTALLWCGVFTQVGSLVGAIISFVSINILQLFTSIPTCPT